MTTTGRSMIADFGLLTTNRAISPNPSSRPELVEGEIFLRRGQESREEPLIPK
jgi:hypothetical protein